MRSRRRLPYNVWDASLSSSPRESAMRFSLFERLARLAVHHKWLVVLSWIGALVLISVVSAVASGSYSTEFRIPGSESQRAYDLLQQRFPARSGSDRRIVFHSDTPLTQSPLKERVQAIVDQARTLPDATNVT